MITIDMELQPRDLVAAIEATWSLAGDKIRSIQASSHEIGGTPVFTIDGRYVAQGWTEWTQGFQYGAAILQFDATDEVEFLDLGRDSTIAQMASHITHIGVHDHGFNQVSTYGNLLRLMREGRIAFSEREQDLYELALKASGAVQAARWTATSENQGYIHSFNGPHSLFCDTIRSLRALALSHRLGHTLWGENDLQISLLERLIQHATATAKYNVYYGEQRDTYDVWGRVSHESIFNVTNGQYRCPSTQQGYSPFTTWTRGLSWIMAGYPELLQFLATVDDHELSPLGGREAIEAIMLRAAMASCDFYLENSPTCGIPYWDTGAPGLSRMNQPLDCPADPFNRFEPVDSSAAAIGVQGLLRLGQLLRSSNPEAANRYWQAGLTVLQNLLREPYLSTSREHQGLLLHTIYHRPRGWDHTPAGASIPQGESCMWGDYHLMEACLYVERVAKGLPEFTFFGPSD
ncbi:MAG: glycosyl hydrolase [Pirellulaceae bacterium]|nr:glycosyl hydrolase [Pirellulaceae bacterium]